MTPIELNHRPVIASTDMRKGSKRPGRYPPLKNVRIEDRPDTKLVLSVSYQYPENV